MKNIILIGPPRIGKTTVIRSVISKLTDRCAGFYTEEILQEGQRAGFKLITCSKGNCVLAHKEIKGHYHVGKYGVNLECVEDYGVPSIKKGIKAQQVIIIDEIGKMEILSRPFKLAVLDALDSKCPVIGTMLFKRHPFYDKIRARKDVEVLDVTEENRDKLPDIVIQKMQ